MTLLKIDDIRRNGGTQPRTELDQSVVSEYASLMANGAVFPPVEVTYDGENYWLVDGFHRIKAAKTAGLTEFEADITPGTHEDAQWRSFAVNATHGLRRTTADKQHAIKAALKHPQGTAKSDREIAAHVGVDHKTVARVRTELSAGGEIPHLDQRVGADGKSYPSTQPPKPQPKPPSWLEQLLPEKWYPVKMFIKHIWDDPFETWDAGVGDPRYRFSFSFEKGLNLKNPIFWGYTLGEAAPAPTEEHMAAVRQDIALERLNANDAAMIRESLDKRHAEQNSAAENPTVKDPHPEWLAQIQPDMYYPFKMQERRLWMDPQPGREAIWHDPRYWNHANVPGKLIIETGQFWTFEIVEPSPATDEEVADYQEHLRRLATLSEKQSAATNSTVEVEPDEDDDAELKLGLAPDEDGGEDDALTFEEEQWAIDLVNGLVKTLVDRFAFRITGEDILEYMQDALLAMMDEGV